MYTHTRVYWLIALAIVAATWLASGLLYPSLPSIVPTHWNIHGEVDAYGAKSWAVFLVPAVMPLFLVFFWFLPALSPKNFEVESFRSTYLYIMVVIITMFAYIHGVTLFACWRHAGWPGRGADMGRALVGGIFLFLGLVGNVMGKVQRNFYVGVRTPWTLASDRVWNDTHRLAAWCMVAGSLLGFLLAVTGFSLIAAFAVLMSSLLIPVVYSFVHYKQLERRGVL
jgi:uncharacterized membrane protein